MGISNRVPDMKAAFARKRAAAMREHIARLTNEHDIQVTWIERADEAGALREADGGRDEILIPPIQSPVIYATALHEVGHILGRYQRSPHVLVRHRWAWQWARKHALVWTPTMEKFARASLRQAALRERR